HNTGKSGIFVPALFPVDCDKKRSASLQCQIGVGYPRVPGQRLAPWEPKKERAQNRVRIPCAALLPSSAPPKKAGKRRLSTTMRCRTPSLARRCPVAEERKPTEYPETAQ